MSEKTSEPATLVAYTFRNAGSTQKRTSGREMIVQIDRRVVADLLHLPDRRPPGCRVACKLLPQGKCCAVEAPMIGDMNMSDARIVVEDHGRPGPDEHAYLGLRQQIGNPLQRRGSDHAIPEMT